MDDQNNKNTNDNNFGNNVQFSLNDTPFGQLQNNDDVGANKMQESIVTEPPVSNFNFSMNDTPFGQIMDQSGSSNLLNQNSVSNNQVNNQVQDNISDSNKFFNQMPEQNSSSGIDQTLYPEVLEKQEANVALANNVVVNQQVTNQQQNTMTSQKPKKTIFDILRGILYTIACVVLLCVIGLFVLRFTCVKTLSCVSSTNDSLMGNIGYEFVTEFIFDKVYHEKMIITIDYSSFSESEREAKIKEAMNGDTYSKENGSEFLSEGFEVNSHSIERNGNTVVVTLDAYKSLSNYFKKSDEAKNITEYSKEYTQMGFVCVE